MKTFSFFLVGICSAIMTVAAANSQKFDATDDFFASTNILKIQIEMRDADVETLKKYQWRFGAQTDREQVSVVVRDGVRVYTNVALHLKGAAGSFRPITDNPAMTLNFDKHVKNQTFHGLEKFSLNNSVQDQTLVSEQLCRELFAQAGVAVPRATHAVVELNGRPLGVYVLVEGYNKQFLKRHFKKASGNLYDGGFLKDVDADLGLNVGDDPKDQSDRIRLLEAAREPDLAMRRSRLEEVLDIEKFIAFVALDVMLWDWDGYAQNRNNWRLYHDPSTGKMVFMPHGLDQMFWKPEGSILPPMQGLVAKAVLQVPEFRARYVAKIKELRQTVFLPEKMVERARAIAAKVSHLVERHDPDKAREQQKALAGFCDAIERRASSIDQQLATPMTPVKFDETGTALLTQWASKNDFGRPVMDRDEGVLKIGTGEGSSIGTWRTRVWLEPGRYRLEGRVKASAITPDIGDTRGGAGLRLVRSRPEKYILGTSEWTPVIHEFSVDDPLAEVQVLCEFRGASGEAVFDSVKLSRLPAK